MEKVQRLGGGRSIAASNRLKIESVPTERWPQDERPEPGQEPGEAQSRAVIVLGIHGWCMAVLSWWVALSG